MKFGIFYEISVPRPWDREAEKRVFDNCLEQVALADELGFDTVWAVEHHFLEEYSHCSAPEIFLTPCAMRTKKMRTFNDRVVGRDRCLSTGIGVSECETAAGGFSRRPLHFEP